VVVYWLCLGMPVGGPNHQTHLEAQTPHTKKLPTCDPLSGGPGEGPTAATRAYTPLRSSPSARSLPPRQMISLPS
jgi:hypothetical protein